MSRQIRSVGVGGGVYQQTRWRIHYVGQTCVWMAVICKLGLCGLSPYPAIHFGSLLTGNIFSICGGAALWARGGALGPDNCFT